MATNRPKLKFLRGSTYTFDVSNADLATHPFKFTADSGSTEYTSGVTLTGTQGQSGAEITFVVPNNAPTNLNYYCGTHGMGMGNHIFIPPFPEDPESDGSFFGSYRSHFNVTAGSGTLYGGTGNSGTVYFMAINEGVPPTNESDGSFFIDSDMTITTDSDTQYGGGYGLVFNIQKSFTWGGSRGFSVAGSHNDQLDYAVTVIEYLDINTTGNTADFGDLTIRKLNASATGNGTYAVCMGGATSNTNPPTPANSDVIDRWTCATPGNASDFGNITIANQYGACVGDGTYGILGGGTRSGSSTRPTIDYITIETPGDATDFGDLTTNSYNLTSTNDMTRGVFIQGTQGNNIDYITMATPGNAASFGSTSSPYKQNNTNGVISNNIRGTWAGGTYTDEIHYLTIQTTGNSSSFGDLTVARGYLAGTSNPSTGRGLAMGGLDNPTRYNTIDYWDIATTGNAQDFGDLLQVMNRPTGASGKAA